MEIVIREFHPGEEKEIMKIGMAAFKSMEGLFITKPKTAKVAVVDGKLVGAMYYHMIHYGKKSLCYLAYAFVHPDYHGKGVGTKLYKETIEYVRSQGCEQITALVKGDNIGSFGLVEKNGLKRCSMVDMIKLIGIRGVMAIFWKTEQNIATGMDFYSTGVKQKTGSLKECGVYLLLNSLLLLLSFWSHKTQFLPYIAAAVTIFTYTILLGSAIKLISKQPWHFRMNNCGLLTTMIVTVIGGVFPLVGRWYPEHYSHEKKERRELCISAMLEWDGLLLTGVLVHLLAPEQLYWSMVQLVIGMMLVYRCIPTYPFSEYGANRVWKYNKLVYAIQFIVTFVFLNYI